MAFVAKAARDSAKRAVFAAASETRPQRDIHATLVLRLFSRLGLRLCPSSASPLTELSILQLPGRTRTCSGGNDCHGILGREAEQGSISVLDSYEHGNLQ
ncbi:hypothetical protein ACSS6W_001428 [Trichoderma asperelloides]